MLESAKFRLFIHHDDEEREYAYENGAEKVFAIAQEKRFTIVSNEKGLNEISDERQTELLLSINCFNPDETVVKEH